MTRINSVVLFFLLWGCLATAVAAQAGVAGPAGSELRARLLYEPVTKVETPAQGQRFDGLLKQEGAVESPRDPWLAFDKAQHFGFSLLITVGSQYALENKLTVDRRNALPASVATSFSIGLAKEIYDWQYGPRGHFSERDLVANAAGILVAAGFILL